MKEFKPVNFKYSETKDTLDEIKYLVKRMKDLENSVFNLKRELNKLKVELKKEESKDE